VLGVPTRSILDSLGAEVRQRRKDRDLSQEELAHRSGYSRAVVSKLERGEENVAVMTLFAIAVTLEVSMTELFAGAEAALRFHTAGL
jgi:transcriptional regulator with XRE-family HTH domain